LKETGKISSIAVIIVITFITIMSGCEEKDEPRCYDYTYELECDHFLNRPFHVNQEGFYCQYEIKVTNICDRPISLVLEVYSYYEPAEERETIALDPKESRMLTLTIIGNRHFRFREI